MYLDWFSKTEIKKHKVEFYEFPIRKVSLYALELSGGIENNKMIEVNNGCNQINKWN